MIHIPYIFRLGAFLLFAVAIILYDRVFHKGDDQRVWEYGLLCFAGILGALYGAANDAVTSGLSPAYFTLGKGLAGAGPITHQAMVLGAQAGFSAGVIASAIWLFVLRRMPARSRCRLILRHLWIPFALAPFCAVLLPAICGQSDPLRFTRFLKGVLSDSDLAGFLIVWWAHLGAYAGLLAGASVGIFMTKRQAMKQVPQTQAIACQRT